METSAIRTVTIKAARVLLWLVYLWVTVTLVLLLLSFILQLFGANPTAGFVDWVYRSTQRAMAPFRGIFESVTISDQSVLAASRSSRAASTARRWPPPRRRRPVRARSCS